MSGVITYFQLMAWQQHLGRDLMPPSGRDDPDRPAQRRLSSKNVVVPLRSGIVVPLSAAPLTGSEQVRPGPFRRFFARLTGLSGPGELPV
ncbi:hypothetical protein GOB93_08065 [Acetobacter musti]|uniref:Transposase n=1 Tax=Acetobacter musti TaxID=864732 RepID=A0ABX0JNI2_9PROT|nr:hypothetical protein [Acetobacter musti]NHN84599.1 hypothetical protein [Acetobacter musti]